MASEQHLNGVDFGPPPECPLPYMFFSWFAALTHLIQMKGLQQSLMMSWSFESGELEQSEEQGNASNMQEQERKKNHLQAMCQGLPPKLKVRQH